MKKEITKEEFMAVYGKYRPNKLTIFIYKYFSLSTKPDDLYLKNIVNWGLFGMFCLLFLFVILDISGVFVGLFNLLYAILFFTYVGLRFYGNHQINKLAYKISKDLDITIDEYIIYYNKFV